MSVVSIVDLAAVVESAPPDSRMTFVPASRTAAIPLSSVVAMLNATALAIHGSTSARVISDNLRVGRTTRPSSVCATSRVVVAGSATASGSTVSASVAPAIEVSEISLWNWKRIEEPS